MNNNSPIQTKIRPQTRHLMKNILYHDIFSACIVATIMSPIVAVIDSIIIENTNIKRTIKENMSVAANKYTSMMQRAVCQPTSLLTKPHGILFFVYAGTFATYNIANRFTNNDMHVITATTGVNMSLGIIKDKLFVDMYGKDKAMSLMTRIHTPMTRSIQACGIGMFVMRDICILGASLVIPKKCAEYFSVQDDALNYSSKTIETVAQFAAPLMSQLIVAPLHIMGISLVNKPLESSQALTVVRICYVNTLVSKIIRIIPTFILGTIGNQYLMGVFKGRYID